MGYVKWILFISNISNTKKIDVIHFLNADPLIRYFGLFLGLLNKRRTIGTFHHFTYSTLRNIARKIVFSKIYRGVVHTDYLYEVALKSGIKNCVHIEYPVFESFEGITNTAARAFFGIKNDGIKVISAIGGTREPKGLDLLLKALEDVEKDFYLLIAGKEEFFTREFIEQHTEKYKERVVLYLKYLSDDELKMALCASDIIALPYRRSFDGASGPLSEGASLGKCIIGPNHGSLGNIVQKNHLGYVYETENSKSLCEVLDTSIYQDFQYDQNAENYRLSLNPKAFRKTYLELYSLSL